MTTRRGTPTGNALAWAAVAFPTAAVTWVAGAALGTALDRALGWGEVPGLFGSSFVWIGLLVLAAGVIAFPGLMLEILLWRALVITRYPALERDRLSMLQSAAVLAIPWALLWPIDGFGPAALAYLSMVAGLALPRLAVPSLRPGALLGG
jgi:hypothetical protein